MNAKYTLLSFATAAVGTGLMVGLMAAPAYAATGSSAATQQARIATVISRSDTEITQRITDLNNLNTRIQAMVNVSAGEKATLQNEIQTNISGLTSLKASIDAGTDLTTVRNQEKTIFTSFRIYMLVIPQGYILAGADRVNTIDGMMTTLASKLQARISQAQSQGYTVTSLQSALSDFNAKVSDAAAQGQSANSGVMSLVPDQGNQGTITSNHTALVAARGNLKTATQDLQAARADAKTIVQGLKGMKGAATTSATTAQ